MIASDSAAARSTVGAEYLSTAEVRAKVEALDVALAEAPPVLLPEGHPDYDHSVNQRRAFFQQQARLIAERRAWAKWLVERYGVTPP